MSKEIFVWALCVVGGPALIAWSVWSYRGRSPRARRWLGDRVDERSVIFVYPSLGIAMIVGPLASLMPLNPVTGLLIAAPFAMAFCWMSYGLIVFLPIPKFLYPKWARR
ncbi:MAG: hypothetical protein ACT4QG_10845 [Sporichthyaceae bacterium]